jgi:hypothetical protein
MLFLTNFISAANNSQDIITLTPNNNSQNILVKTPTNEPSIEEQNTVNYRVQQRKISSILINIALVVSLIVGAILIIFLIRNPSKNFNLVIHSLLFLGGVIWLISMIFIFLFQFIKHGEIADPDILEMGWPLILPIILSGYLVFNLVRKENFSEEMKYSLNLSSGIMIASILAIIFLKIIGYFFMAGDYGVDILIALIFLLGIICSFILGIIGLVIDKLR